MDVSQLARISPERNGVFLIESYSRVANLKTLSLPDYESDDLDVTFSMTLPENRVQSVTVPFKDLLAEDSSLKTDLVPIFANPCYTLRISFKKGDEIIHPKELYIELIILPPNETASIILLHNSGEPLEISICDKKFRIF
ncbi:hypothetical protein DFS34DRAFT_590897 [Phlyctochytrium arcticum]|nr:hypothetical protein DFS34DRAFT_590897 [Phlyctochytrium arcticum]